MMENAIRQTAEILKAQIFNYSNTGLLSGQMGASLFLYFASRILDEKRYEDVADTLIDNIYDKISDEQQPYHFDDGLSGIAWGFHYLHKNGFLEGDLNEVLEDLDDKIYHYITFSENMENAGVQTLVGFGFYLIERIKYCNESFKSDRKLCFERLLIFIVNRLSFLLEKDKRIIQELHGFSLLYGLPLCIVFLASVYSLNIYNRKVERIFENISSSVTSTIPISRANRFYLVFALKFALQNYKQDDWKKHCELLINTIDINTIIEEDFLNIEIPFLNGKAGFAFLLDKYAELFEDDHLSYDHELLVNSIIHSSFWDIKPDKLNINTLNVATGIAGIGLVLLKTKQPVAY